MGTDIFLSDIQIYFRNECILFSEYYFSPVLSNIAQMPDSDAQFWAQMPPLPDNKAACQQNIQTLHIFIWNFIYF